MYLVALRQQAYARCHFCSTLRTTQASSIRDQRELHNGMTAKQEPRLFGRLLGVWLPHPVMGSEL